ncbi:MAG: DNA repair protein RecN [Candidatus Jettenia caeni]|uniref:DNA repair protein RecN n=1 Tax=Candidatus Jettenia sp. AMX1 TaxID=2293637 RepID=UPI0006858E0E|nr:DNA repair protein RecN [Candidatus Jettenia sp. AMX1]NUN22982.1 DNA repair protein RecN [Candidatus Jettenia caeni]WKZ15342.1 MAG: DNA repair protein RecN [Candidatus Jettenia caeni]GJQ47342.1 MAG: DNA repair protein RecN [Candidatus Jettenia caeni]
MLQELYITNFVLIDKVTIKLCERLNVFSGATGVGKSLVIGALNFILGGRATSDIVQSGKDEATVIAKFHAKDESILKQIKRVSGNNTIEEELLIQRSIDTSGRSRCRLNGIPLTVSMLKEIGEILVSIHGQHEHETLLHGINQLYILDDLGGISSLREDFSEVHQQVIEKTKMRDVLRNNQQERRQRMDLYAFQIEEIDKAQLREGEIEELEKEKNILNNAEKIYTTITSCYLHLYESPDAVVSRLKSVVKELQSIAKLDETLLKIFDVCNQLLYQTEDAAFSLGKFRDSFNYDPQRLEYIEERLNTIRKLKMKYGNTIEEILSYHDEIQVKLKQLSEEKTTAEQVDEELKVLSDFLRQKGCELTRKRVATANKLAPLIDKELHELGMPHGKFLVQITSPFLPDGGNSQASNAHSYGFDQIEFLISPNPGGDLKPLRKIASGGEISRVMLALKHQLAKVDKTSVLVFDEIDANIGGRMGEVIGEKLSSIAKSHQVICITHLPQIACYADEQWKVNKFVKDNKTYSVIENLSSDARLEEIADMIRGSEKTDITRKQAQEMLRDAKKKIKSKNVMKNNLTTSEHE